MKGILWKLTNRMKFGKILTLFITWKMVESGPLIQKLSTFDYPTVSAA